MTLPESTQQVHFLLIFLSNQYNEKNPTSLEVERTLQIHD